MAIGLSIASHQGYPAMVAPRSRGNLFGRTFALAFGRSAMTRRLAAAAGSLGVAAGPLAVAGSLESCGLHEFRIEWIVFDLMDFHLWPFTASAIVWGQRTAEG